MMKLHQYVIYIHKILITNLMTSRVTVFRVSLRRAFT